MGHFFQVSFDQSSCFPCFWVCIWYFSGSSHVCLYLLAMMNSSQETYGQLTSLTMRWCPLSFDLQGAFSEHGYRQGVFLKSEYEEYVVSYLWRWWLRTPPAYAGDVKRAGSIPGLGRSPGAVHGNPLQCSLLENPMVRGAWWATVHKDAQSQTRLKQLSMHSSSI